MDELDLVRLARPEAATPDPDALARMKGAVFAAATTSPVTPATDALPTDDELTVDTAVSRAPRPRRLLATSAAAAEVLAVGGLAVAARHRGGGAGDGGAATNVNEVGTVTDDATAPPSSTDDSAKAIDGIWRTTGGLPDEAPAVVLAINSSAGTFSISVCSTLVGRGVHVRDGRLVLDETPTGIEGRCDDATTRAFQDRVVALVTGGPKIDAGAERLTLSTAGGTLVFARRTTSVGITMPELAARTFGITVLKTPGRELALTLTPVAQITFPDSEHLIANVGCNDIGGTVHIEGDTLVIDEFGSSTVACTGDAAEREALVSTLLTARPTISLVGTTLRLVSGGVELWAMAASTTSVTPGPPTATDRPAQDFSPVTMQQLAGHTFTITSLIEGDTVLAISPMAAFSFPSTDRVGATIGCNGMGGSAAIDAGQLRVTEFGSTLIGCPPAQTEAEQAIGKLLGAPSDIALGARGLRLSGRGVELLAVERAGTPVTTVPLPPTTPPPSRP